MGLKIKCKFCNELVPNKTIHFCSSKRSYIPCDTGSNDFAMGFVMSNFVGDLSPVESSANVDTDSYCDNVNTGYDLSSDNGSSSSYDNGSSYDSSSSSGGFCD